MLAPNPAAETQQAAMRSLAWPIPRRAARASFTTLPQTNHTTATNPSSPVVTTVFRYWSSKMSSAVDGRHPGRRIARDRLLADTDSRQEVTRSRSRARVEIRKPSGSSFTRPAREVRHEPFLREERLVDTSERPRREEVDDDGKNQQERREARDRPAPNHEGEESIVAIMTTVVRETVLRAPAAHTIAAPIQSLDRNTVAARPDR